MGHAVPGLVQPEGQDIIPTARPCQDTHVVCGTISCQHEPPAKGEVLVILVVSDVETGSIIAPTSIGTVGLKIDEVFDDKGINEVCLAVHKVSSYYD